MLVIRLDFVMRKEFVESFGSAFRFVFVGIAKFLNDIAEVPLKFGYDLIQFGVNSSWSVILTRNA